MHEAGSKQESSDAQQTLSDIIRGMQHAVNTAQESLQDYQFQQMSRYFDEDGCPKMVHVTPPEGKPVNIPLITLIPQNTLTIKTLDMTFAVKIASSELKTFKENTEKQLEDEKKGVSSSTSSQRSSFKVFFSNLSPHREESRQQQEKEPDTDVVQIKIQFVATDETEAAARIREMLYKQIG